MSLSQTRSKSMSIPITHDPKNQAQENEDIAITTELLVNSVAPITA